MANGYEQFFQKARAQSSQPRDSRAPHFALEKESHDILVRELRDRLKKKKLRPKRKKVPKGLLIFCIVGSFSAGFAYMNKEKVETWIGKIEVAAMGQAQAEETPKAEDKGKAEAAKDEKATTKEGEKASEKIAEKDSKHEGNDWNDEEVNHFQKLVNRKKELDAREEELNRMEAEMQVQREEIEKKMKTLDETRRNISSVLQERTVEDEKKVDTLTQMYSSMKPVQAAKVLETLDEDLAVQILGRMKKKDAAEVLNLMKAEKAQVFSEKYAGYRKN